MTSKEHKKHSNLAKPAYGNFGRNEWAIVGGECSVIKEIARYVIHALSSSYKCAYIDTSHKEEDTNTTSHTHLSAGAIIECTDHISYQQFNYTTPPHPIHYRQFFSEVDLLLVNGNHHEAKAQIVVIDNNKKASLQKRISQLTHVQMFLLTDNANDVFDFVKEAIPAWQQIPIYKVSETEKIIEFFQDQMLQTKPPINGLILAGGKSVRMGYDKASITWHGKQQQYYMYDMLQSFCKDVFISCREEQNNTINKKYKTLNDTFTGLGPYGAILSAFRQQPNSAWLVTACDLPLLDNTTLQYLIDNRHCASIATTFESPYDGLPEPLITIWEPKSYPILLSFLSQGYSCGRKLLIKNDVKLLKAENPDALINVNTPEDMNKVKQIIQQKNATA